MSRWPFPMACLLAALAAGCATTWDVRTEVPSAPLEWKDAGGRTRIRHIMTIRGFAETGVSASGLLRRALFGRSQDDQLVRPVAVALDQEGRLAIADTGCRCVHLFLPSGRRYMKVTSPGGHQFASPVGLAFDGESRLYVSDSASGALFLFDREGAHLSTLTRPDRGAFLRPTGIASFPGGKTLVAADAQAHEIVALGSDGGRLFSVGSRGAEKGRFNFPTHVAVSAAGRIYVTDAMNFRVQIFDRSGAFVASFGRHGNGSGDFAMPKGIAVDRAGIIYVADALFDAVQLFNMQGEFLFTLGSRGAGPGEFWLPSGVMIDGNNRLYVCDTYNQRIQVFQIEGGDQ